MKINEGKIERIAEELAGNVYCMNNAIDAKEFDFYLNRIRGIQTVLDILGIRYDYHHSADDCEVIGVYVHNVYVSARP